MSVDDVEDAESAGAAGDVQRGAIGGGGLVAAVGDADLPALIDRLGKDLRRPCSS